MNSATLIQAYIFLIFFISGMLIGILFDIFRISRRTFNTTDFVTYLEDILFWIITGLFLIFILFTFSNGEIRLYNVISLIIGFVCYILTISKFFIKINVIILSFLKNISYKILKILIYPIKFLFKPISFFVINVRKLFFIPKNRQKNSKNFNI